MGGSLCSLVRSEEAILLQAGAEGADASGGSTRSGVSFLGPTRGQRPAACLTTNKTFQREVGPRSLTRAGHLHASFSNCLNAVERFFADECLKIATPRHAEFPNMDQTGVQAIREHSAEALGIHREAAACAKAETRDGVEHFLFRETARREFLEGSRNQRAALRIRNQTLS